MTPPQPALAPPSNRASDSSEILALISVLVETEKRLELLTRGEIDTVSNSEGRTLMLWRAQQYARRSEAARQSVFLKAMDATSDAIYLVDRASMRIVHVNDSACRMQNLTREAVMARGPVDALQTTRAELEQLYDRIIANGVPAEPLEIRRPRTDGPAVWLELRRHPLRSGKGWMIVTLVRDITEQKKAKDRIIYLNRVYAMLSGINALIVRVRTCQELFDQACDIAAREGGFAMTMIAMLDPVSGKISPMASFGMASDVLSGLKARFASTQVPPAGPALGQTLAERVVRDKHPIVNNDLKSDPSAIYAKQHVDAGIRAMAILPLLVADEAVGVLALYAKETDFFQEEELKLLMELARDIAFAVDHIQKQDRLDYLAYYDVLTGLANRTLFLERVAQHLRTASLGGHRLALMLMDVERFKNINDSLGQCMGDTLLRQIAQWLTQSSGDAMLVARVGTDHFAVVRPVVGQDERLDDLVEQRLNTFSEHPFQLDGALLRVSFKMGVALFPQDGLDADTLFKNAEAALKKAKLQGERYLFYTPAMTTGVAGKLTLENRLRQALENGEFELHYQPKIKLETGKITGAEALIRWNDPQSGLLGPNHFIPILEETGLIHEVGLWALRRAIADYLRWRLTGLNAVRIAVNVSSLQLRRRDFVQEIGQAISIDAAAAAGLELEITESVLMSNVKHSFSSLRAIRALKVGVAIDDFGTGFSSLSYLAKLPVDTLKIDRSFVVDMTSGAQGLALVSTIINLGHALKLNVIAEGVETEEQSGLLRLLGCDEIQGFLFSKPLPREIFEATYLVPAKIPVDPR